MSVIYWLIIGAIAGWLAGQLTKGSGFGVIGNIVVGIVGALLGGLLFGLLGLQSTNVIGSLITSVIGAVVLLFVVGLVRR